MSTETDDPLLGAINALVALHFPPKSVDPITGIGYGKELYFFGDDPFMGPTWILDGMTPVPVDYVIRALKGKGADVAGFEEEIEYRRKRSAIEAAQPHTISVLEAKLKAAKETLDRFVETEAKLIARCDEVDRLKEEVEVLRLISCKECVQRADAELERRRSARTEKPS